jgi:alpha-galactosidase/6-phospho-beta-glucosidase family protein
MHACTEHTDMHDLSGGEHQRGESVVIGFVGGGSRDWAKKLMHLLALTTEFSGTVRLYDLDYESAKTNAELGRRVQAQDEAVGDWTYEAVETLEAALTDADFVVCSTQDPPAETFAKDLDIPQEYGIYQTVGDTVGPGGTFRALRSIPQYREVAAVVREHCPDAWVFNFTNPMTVCTRTLHEEYPDINAIGICHEVYHVQEWLAELAEKHLDVADTDYDDVDVTVKGVNHFTWIDEATLYGHDLFDAVDAELASRDPPAYGRGDGEIEDQSVYATNHEVTLDLYRRYGILPAAGDRHLVEFVPWYLDPVEAPEDVHRWGIKLTPSEHRVESWPEAMAEREAILDGEQEVEISDPGEEMVDLMKALLGQGAVKTNVNVPNQGQVANLPEGAVVETNALLTRDSVTPLSSGALPDPVATLVERHVRNQETLVEAGFAGDLDLAFRAFRNEPLVTVDPVDAESLFADLVEAERSYLDAYDIEGADVLN